MANAGDPTLHATAVAVRGAGLLLLGPPGAGKSSLALQLIDRGAILVADDRVRAWADAGELWLAPPPTLAGLLEVRGVGLIRMAHLTSVRARLLLDLGAAPKRLPSPAQRIVAGVALPALAFDPRAPDSPIRAELAVALARRGTLGEPDVVD